MSKMASHSIDLDDRHVDPVCIVEDLAEAIHCNVWAEDAPLAFFQGVLPISHANFKWRALCSGDDMSWGLRLDHS